MSVRDEIFFEARDPRGYVVICTRRCWYEHILANRSWMETWEKRVIAAIEDPSYGIFQDPDYEDRCIYYRRQQTKGRLLKVVVKVSEVEPFEVVTAFTTDSTKEGEKWIWPKSD